MIKAGKYKEVFKKNSAASSLQDPSVVLNNSDEVYIWGLGFSCLNVSVI